MSVAAGWCCILGCVRWIPTPAVPVLLQNAGTVRFVRVGPRGERGTAGLWGPHGARSRAVPNDSEPMRAGARSRRRQDGCQATAAWQRAASPGAARRRGAQSGRAARPVDGAAAAREQPRAALGRRPRAAHGQRSAAAGPRGSAERRGDGAAGAGRRGLPPVAGGRAARPLLPAARRAARRAGRGLPRGCRGQPGGAEGGHGRAQVGAGGGLGLRCWGFGTGVLSAGPSGAAAAFRPRVVVPLRAARRRSALLRSAAAAEFPLCPSPRATACVALPCPRCFPVLTLCPYFCRRSAAAPISRYLGAIAVPLCGAARTAFRPRVPRPAGGCGAFERHQTRCTGPWGISYGIRDRCPVCRCCSGSRKSSGCPRRAAGSALHTRAPLALRARAESCPCLRAVRCAGNEGGAELRALRAQPALDAVSAQ